MPHPPPLRDNLLGTKTPLMHRNEQVSKAMIYNMETEEKGCPEYVQDHTTMISAPVFLPPGPGHDWERPSRPCLVAGRRGIGSC
ncbi:unnamed protein product [Gulo gulo]|uniref:Uncharacterized protein n=1 Tax=Gulo gulo TaxID=48420 RepID=A0A9X9MBV7_GULGU|nr:unnamed protein product [Gulo gulo]